MKIRKGQIKCRIKQHGKKNGFSGLVCAKKTKALISTESNHIILLSSGGLLQFLRK